VSTVFDSWFDRRRLKAAGVVLPVAFIVGLEFIRGRVTHAGAQPETHRVFFVGITLLCITGFAAAMFYFIDRAHDDLERRNDEARAINEVLLAISRQEPMPGILETVVAHARSYVGAHDAVLCLGEEASVLVRHEDAKPDLTGVRLVDVPRRGPTQRTVAGLTVTDATPAADPRVHPHHAACAVREAANSANAITVPVVTTAGQLAELWIARTGTTPFAASERAFLSTLSGLAGVALTGAQERENGRQAAIVAERERIAREMHDSLAQALGVTHLRLRALDGRSEVRASREVATELSALADICEEAYHDVREAILGLRQSCGNERGLLDSMSAYLEKYSHQCGIEATLVSELEHELSLSPSCEVQMIRVIQEALTNVRKHSGAKTATVRISESESATTFVVEDDGAGFDLSDAGNDRGRFGMFTMRERMGLLNGSLVVDSAPGRGTRVIADVPERSIRRSRSA
jgi:nitrate/nitrite-specific signal transduction histidine kinase